MKHSKSRLLAVLMATIACAAAVCTVCFTNSDADQTTASQYNVDDYLKYIPELKPGCSAGAYAELDSDDAYQLIKIYANSFKIPVDWTSQYNQMILKSVKGSSDISDFTSNLSKRVLEYEGINAEPKIVPEFAAHLAFTLTVGGTEEAPTLEIKMKGLVDASVQISNSGKELVSASANVPITMYAVIHMSKENIPLGIDCQLKLSYKLNMKDSTGDETITISEDVDCLNLKFTASIDSISRAELNSVINNSSSSVTKNLRVGMLVECKENGSEAYGSGFAGNVSVNLSEMGIREGIDSLISKIKMETGNLSSSDVKNNIKDNMKSLMEGVIPSYEEVKWLLNLAGVTEKDYVMASILAMPYLGQTTRVLKEIKNYAVQNDLASYYLTWNNSSIHSDKAVEIQEKADVDVFKPSTDPIGSGEWYELYTYEGKTHISRFHYYGPQTSTLVVAIPDRILGKEIQCIDYGCFKGVNTTKLNLTMPDTIKDVSERAIQGYDYSGIGGTIKYYPNSDKTGFGFTLDSWMENGKSHAIVTGWINGNVTGNQAITIPSEITVTGKTIAVESIADQAFFGCNELSEITIPDSISKIGWGAFQKCSNLKTVKIGQNVCRLDWTFDRCSNLEEITINAKDVEFRGTFRECTKLTSIVMIAGAPKYIGEWAFEGVKIDPTQIPYGDNTISWIELTPDIEKNSFTGITCPGGLAFTYGSTSYECWKTDGKFFYNLRFSDVNAAELTIPATAKQGDKYEGTVIEASVQLPNITKLVIDAPLQSLELNGLSKLMDLTINAQSSISSLKKDGFLFVIQENELLFCNGSGNTIDLPDSVEYLYCEKIPSAPNHIVVNGNDMHIESLPTNITKITLGPNVKAFFADYCQNITYIDVMNGNDSYKSVDGVLFTSDDKLVKYPVGKTAESYAVPDQCRSIGHNAFLGSSLKTITLNKQIEFIDTDAFSGCKELVTITVPENNNSVFIKDGMLYSNDIAIRCVSNVDVIILSGEVAPSAFETVRPKVLVVQDYPHSHLWIYYPPKIETIIIPDTMSCDSDGHIVKYSTSWLYTQDFTTDGKTVRMTVTALAMVESSEIMLDGATVSKGSTVSFEPSDLLGKSWISVAVQPAQYNVKFDTANGPSVTTQKVYYHYCANIPNEPYRSGFTFTGWYADKGCTIAFDFEKPILCDTTIYAGWKVVQTVPSEPDIPSQPVKPEPKPEKPDEPKTTEKTTVTKDEDGNTVTKTEKNTEFSDGSKVSSETTTVVKDDGGIKKTTTESKETVTDAEGNVSGSTSMVKTEKESDAGKSTVTSTTSKDGNGDETQTVTKVEIESKDSSISTSGEFVKESSGNTSLSVGTSITVDSHADDMNISHEQMSTAIEQAKEALDSMGLSDEEKKCAEVTVEIRSERFNDSIASLEMPSESFLAASESNANLKLTSEVGSMTISKDVSKNLSEKGDNISVSMSVADKSKFNSEQKAVVGDCPVYSLKALAGDESVHELGGEVSVSVKYTLKPGDDPQAITVYYVNDQGKLSKQITSYDPATHTLTFKTDHFSYFMIANSADLAVADEDERDGSSSTIIIAAVVAVAVIAVATIMIKRSH